MRARLVLLLVPLLAVAGCVDALLDPAEPSERDPFEPQESVEVNETDLNATDPNATEETTVTTPPPAVVSPTPPPATTPSPTPTPPPPEPTPPPPPPSETPTPPPPSPTPAPPPPSPTPPPPTPPPTTPTPPPPSPTPPPPVAWPREGSHVTYEIASSTGAPDGSYFKEATTRATWVYTDGDWRGSCEGTVRETYDGETRTSTVTRTFAPDDPPHWPLFNTRNADPGDTIRASIMWWCDISFRDATVSEETADSLHAHDLFPYGEFRSEWDAQTGLVLSWEDQGRNSVSRGRVVSTDAESA